MLPERSGGSVKGCSNPPTSEDSLTCLRIRISSYGRIVNTLRSAFMRLSMTFWTLKARPLIENWWM